MGVVVYGGSDDLIEVEGDVTEEFPYRGEAGSGDLVALSNGVVLRVEFGDQGVWRIAPVAGADLVSVRQAPEGDEEDYSDRASVEGEVRWVVQGVAFARAGA